MKKTILHILSRSVWTIIIVFISISVLMHIPAVQGYIANVASSAISKKLDTKVEIGSIYLGFFNRIIINEFVVYDQKDKKMLRSSRVSAKLSPLELIQGRIEISSAQLFGLDARLYKEKHDGQTNFQFVLDSLKSKDDGNTTPLDLQIASLVIRNGAVSYDCYEETETPNIFNPEHIGISRISGHIMLNSLTDNDIDANIKHLTFKEKAGFELKHFSAHLIADKRNATIEDFSFQLPNTNITMPEFRANNILNNGKLDIANAQYKCNVKINKATYADIASFLPNNFDYIQSVSGDITVEGSDNKIKASADIHSSGNNLSIHLAGNAHNLSNTPQWKLSDINIKIKEGILYNLCKSYSLPQQILTLGDVSLTGSATGKDNIANADIDLSCSNIGTVIISGNYGNNNINTDIKTDGIHIGKLLSNDDLGTIKTEFSLSSDIKPSSSLDNININGIIHSIDYKGYTYKNINLAGSYINKIIKGDVSIDDPNITLALSGNAQLEKEQKNINATASVTSLRPQRLGLTDQWGDANYMFDIDASIAGYNLDNAAGHIIITDFTQSGFQKDGHLYSNSYKISKLNVSSNTNKGVREITLNSDFADAELRGRYSITTLVSDFTSLISNYFPALQQSTGTHKVSNNLHFNATIKDDAWLHRLLDVDIDINKPVQFGGFVNGNNNQANILLDIPAATVFGNHLVDSHILMWTPDNSLRTKANINIKNNVTKPALNISAEANVSDNIISSVLKWDNNQSDVFRGTVRTSATMEKLHDGSSSFNVSIAPSTILLGDSTWHLHSRDIIYGNDRLEIDHFAIENSNQHLYVNGVASKLAKDTLIAELKNLDVKYILDLVNFHSVEFGGYASGKVKAQKLFSSPEASAHLDVAGFLFEEGYMGNLHADAELNNSLKQIDIDAYTADEHGKCMDIIGQVSPQREDLELNITADRVHLEFLEFFCGSFMKDINATANGFVKVYGPFSNINLTGQVVPKGTLHIIPLGCTYKIEGDTIDFIPDDIVASKLTLQDKFGNKAFLKGGLHHKHLTRMTYDFDINAEKFLGFDTHEFGEGTFYGTAFLTGDCKITGRSSELTIDVNGDVCEGSRIVYNASSPDAISHQEFVTWNSKNKKKEETAPPTTEETDLDDVRTNIRMNLLFNVTPQSSLYLVMDPTTGDYIDLHGTGVLRASYYNKGAFDLFGNYVVDNGIYKMTIQNILRRDFEFQPGGTITFGGNPFNASLNMQAKYTVNSVPLSDLNIGSSFSNNNIRVNCFMNITGTAGAPKVEFDMDLPTVNTEAKKMIYSLINSEEEMNQQVLYLLSVGRFYSQTGNNAGMQDNNSNNATTLAMQSIVSGTLSQQINNVLSSVITNHNWNFGANISPGDEGFTNAEYEGLLNGSLLNNRLLFNGQFGYRDNAATSQQGFIGDFDLRYLLVPSGNFAVRVYNQANDRYFTRNSLNTQGLGLIIKKDFNTWRELFTTRKKNTKAESK